MKDQHQENAVEFDVFQYHHHDNGDGMAPPYGQPGQAYSPSMTPSMSDEYHNQYQQPQHGRPSTRPMQSSGIDYNPTGWTPTRPQRYSGQSSYTNETPWQSRPGSPSMGGHGRITPPEGVDGLQPPRNVFDSWPPTPSPMVSDCSFHREVLD